MTRTALSQPTLRRSRRIPAVLPVVHSTSKRAQLRAELIRQRVSLLTDWKLSLGVPDEHEPCADRADQVTHDLAQDLALRVKMRVITKLKCIERALLLVRTKHYGCCRRCHKAIPYERLTVQPDARYCVPCLTLVETRASRH